MFSQGNGHRTYLAPASHTEGQTPKVATYWSGYVRVKPSDMLGRVSDALMSTMYIEALVKVKV